MRVEVYLSKLQEQLFDSKNWRKIELSRKWTSTISDEAGVYVLRENKEIVYVGETGSLRGRMNDLLDSRHHCVRRTIGKTFFSGTKGFQPANTRSKFPPHIEILVDKHITSKYSVALLPAPLGRKELEEFIAGNLKVEKGLNKRCKRRSH